MLKVFASLTLISGQPSEDKFTSLPNGDTPINMPSDSYAGYLNATESGSKQLYYIFTESQSDPRNDPVVIWFGGGPGCSSVQGFILQNGPIIYDINTNVIGFNEYSWNSKANMLYIENPAGVGFSLAASEQDMIHNDMSTSIDAIAAL